MIVEVLFWLVAALAALLAGEWNYRRGMRRSRWAARMEYRARAWRQIATLDSYASLTPTQEDQR